MKDYVVVHAKNCAELESSVNRKLSEGYQLIGGVGVAIDGACARIFQALAKPA